MHLYKHASIARRCIEAIECVINVRLYPSIGIYIYFVLLFSEKFNLFSERFFTSFNVLGPVQLPTTGLYICDYVIYEKGLRRRMMSASGGSVTVAHNMHE